MLFPSLRGAFDSFAANHPSLIIPIGLAIGACLGAWLGMAIARELARRARNW